MKIAIIIWLNLIALACFLLSWITPGTLSELLFKNKLTKEQVRVFFGACTISLMIILTAASDSDKERTQDQEIAQAEQGPSEASQPTQQTEETPQESAQQPTIQPAFDIPSLIGKNIDEVVKILGKPESSPKPTKAQQTKGAPDAGMFFSKDGAHLLVGYNFQSKVVFSFFIDGNDKEKLLALGNLQEKSDAYNADFVQNMTDKSKVLGVKVSKKLPNKLDGEIAYSAVAFQVSNNEDYNWTDCKFQINSGFIDNGYVYNTSSGIKTKEKITIPFSDFTDSGKRFDFITQKPENLRISCSTNGQVSRSNYFTIN